MHEALLSRVERRGRCWIWTGPTRKGGYGLFRFRGRRGSAHRAAYEEWVGPIPEGHHVLHHCDAPACIRPKHLFTGTHAVNMADRDRKGRGKVPVRARGGWTGRVRRSRAALLAALLPLALSGAASADPKADAETTARVNEALEALRPTFLCTTDGCADTRVVERHERELTELREKLDRWADYLESTNCSPEFGGIQCDEADYAVKKCPKGKLGEPGDGRCEGDPPAATIAFPEPTGDFITAITDAPCDGCRCRYVDGREIHRTCPPAREREVRALERIAEAVERPPAPPPSWKPGAPPECTGWSEMPELCAEWMEGRP